MLVRQLVGRYAGEMVEMPFAAARACVDAGTARLPDVEPQARRVTPEAQATAAAAPAALSTADAPPSLRGRRKRG